MTEQKAMSAWYRSIGTQDSRMLCNLLPNGPGKRYRYDPSADKLFLYDELEQLVKAEIEGQSQASGTLARDVEKLRCGQLGRAGQRKLQALIGDIAASVESDAWLPLHDAVTSHGFVPIGWSLVQAQSADDCTRQGWFLSSIGPGLVIPRLLRSSEDIVAAIRQILAEKPIPNPVDPAKAPKSEVYLQGRTAKILLLLSDDLSVRPGPAASTMDAEEAVELLSHFQRVSTMTPASLTRWQDLPFICVSPVGYWDESVPDFVGLARDIQGIRGRRYQELFDAYRRDSICGSKLAESLTGWVNEVARTMDPAEIAEKIAVLLQEKYPFEPHNLLPEGPRRLIDELKDRAMEGRLEEQALLSEKIQQAMETPEQFGAQLVYARESSFGVATRAASRALRHYPELGEMGSGGIAWYWRAYLYDRSQATGCPNQEDYRIDQCGRDPAFLCNVVIRGLQDRAFSVSGISDGSNGDELSEITDHSWCLFLAWLLARALEDELIEPDDARSIVEEANWHLQTLSNSIAAGGWVGVALKAGAEGPELLSQCDKAYCDQRGMPMTRML